MKGFVAACSVIALVWFGFPYTNHVLHRHHHTTWLWAGGEVGHPTPTDGEVHECVGSTNWTTYYEEPSWSIKHPLGAETAFTLPSTEVSDTVDVRVRVAYHHDEALDRATICHVERAENEQGVGIFTPPDEPPYDYRDQLKFDVTLTLPAGSDGALLVKNLETELPDYSQNIGDLWESVLFENIHLSSSNGRLHAESVTAESAQFSSSNGGITANGEIHSKVALTSDSGTGGEFEVDTESSNGGIGLIFTDSTCRLCSKMSSSHVPLARLMNVEQREGVEDPAGNGRQREVSVNRTKGL
ncbi:hypothetical protein BU15DRAFT_72404 [Melanogaster broomeanus]|nr:hypothetical protein BU15DRAFT_72404 [Melanogaster broomeanus]